MRNSKPFVSLSFLSFLLIRYDPLYYAITSSRISVLYVCHLSLLSMYHACFHNRILVNSFFFLRK
jgi:hypothetical protein